MKRAGSDGNGNFIHDDARVHSSVVLGWGNWIGPRVIIGEGTVLGHRNIFERDVVIGVDVKIHNNVELRAFTEISDECEIDSGVKSSGRNKVGPRTVLRYDAIIARGCVIGEECYICPQVMTNNLDHNMDEVGGAHVGDFCFIGTASVLGAGINIAKGSLVGSCANVTKTIEEPYHVWYGNPARDQGGRDFVSETVADEPLTTRDEFNPPSGLPGTIVKNIAEVEAEQPEPAEEEPGPSAKVDTDSAMSGGGEEG